MPRINARTGNASSTTSATASLIQLARLPRERRAASRLTRRTAMSMTRPLRESRTQCIRCGTLSLPNVDGYPREQVVCMDNRIRLPDAAQDGLGGDCSQSPFLFLRRDYRSVG